MGVHSKLINKSVRQTVDLRALTKTPPPSASAAEKAEALEENMILVVESARAIGCSVTENMEVELARGDHSAIDRLVLELIKVSLVGGCGLTSGHAHFSRSLVLFTCREWKTSHLLPSTI